MPAVNISMCSSFRAAGTIPRFTADRSSTGSNLQGSTEFVTTGPLLIWNAYVEIIRDEKPDLIECVDPYQLAWMILDTSRESKIPAVAFYHSHFPEACFGFARRFGTRFASSVGKYSRLYVSHLYNKFRKTLVPSAGLAEVLAGWGVANVVTVNLGVDTTTFRAGARSVERRGELNIGPEQILLL